MPKFIMTLEFVITPRIRSALSYIKGCQASRASFENALASFARPEQTTITLDALKILSQQIRIAQKSSHGASGSYDGPLWFHELVQGAGIHTQPTPTQAPSLSDNKRQLLQANLDNMRYKKMTENVSFNKAQADVRDQQEIKAFNSQMSIGINIMVSMAVGLTVGWYLGHKVLGGHMWGLALGLVCMVGIMLVETWLFVIRTSKVNQAAEEMNLKEKGYTKKGRLSRKVPQGIFGPPAVLQKDTVYELEQDPNLPDPSSSSSSSSSVPAIMPATSSKHTTKSSSPSPSTISPSTAKGHDEEATPTKQKKKNNKGKSKGK